MPDLHRDAVRSWLHQHGSAAIDASTPAGGALDEHADIFPSLLALGETLDQAHEADRERTCEVLAGQPGASTAAVIMSAVSGGRRMRLLHWIEDLQAGGSTRVLDAVLGAEPTGPGADLRQWVLDLHRRDLMTRLFAEERLQALVAACQSTPQPEQE